ncbi:MAG TPA: hypothetical protein VFK05_19545 [Polyangiaceae bacterium]|nr:hypothetical protein [Polyangiaceae bacterium]
MNPQTSSAFRGVVLCLKGRSGLLAILPPLAILATLLEAVHTRAASVGACCVGNNAGCEVRCWIAGAHSRERPFQR